MKRVKEYEETISEIKSIINELDKSDYQLEILRLKKLVLRYESEMWELKKKNPDDIEFPADDEIDSTM